MRAVRNHSRDLKDPAPAAGLAMHLLESLTGDPSPYVRSLSPDRFIPRDWSWEDARRDAQAVYENY